MKFGDILAPKRNTEMVSSNFASRWSCRLALRVPKKCWNLFLSSQTQHFRLTTAPTSSASSLNKIRCSCERHPSSLKAGGMSDSFYLSMPLPNKRASKEWMWHTWAEACVSGHMAINERPTMASTVLMSKSTKETKKRSLPSEDCTGQVDSWMWMVGAASRELGGGEGNSIWVEVSGSSL